MVIEVRLQGPTEEAVRRAAQEMGVQVGRCKKRDDGWHLYGTKVLA